MPRSESNTSPPPAFPLSEAPSPEILQPLLDGLYQRYNRPEYIDPDPLDRVRRYPDLLDREVVGMVSAALAFGNVKQILTSVDRALDRIPFPAADVACASRKDLARRFAGFRHRYSTGEELVALLVGIRELWRRHGSLEAAFLAGWRPDDETTVPALARFCDALRAAGGLERNYLLPDPRRGSACKRLHMFLRWMVRNDAVDPGGWGRVRPGQLVVPVDTHMHAMALALGLTRARQATGRTALEVTRAFRCFAPEDPVRYDFALTRLGIRRLTAETEALLVRLSGTNGPGQRAAAVG